MLPSRGHLPAPTLQYMFSLFKIARAEVTSALVFVYVL